MPGNELVEQNTDISANAPEGIIECPRCGAKKMRARRSPHLCVDCEKAENVRYSYMRRHQDNWTEVAAESGLDLWVQQPEETQWEYSIWCAYRDSYPGKRASYGDIARQMNTTYGVVKKIAQRWTFPVRMQAWISYTQKITLAQRRQEILDMNADHISMSQKLRSKLHEAIDLVDPLALRPGEIVQLGKLAAELERKAMTDSISQQEMLADIFTDNENPELKKTQTKSDDLSEVLSILLSSGALGDVSQAGVRQTTTTTTTTTTEVVGKKNNGDVVTIDVQEE